jgi:hypothetical protein
MGTMNQALPNVIPGKAANGEAANGKAANGKAAKTGKTG